MTYRLDIFDAFIHGKLGEHEAWLRMFELIEAGHAVKTTEVTTHQGTVVLTQAWLEFETEEELAIFKLTHL